MLCEGPPWDVERDILGMLLRDILGMLCEGHPWDVVRDLLGML